MRAGTVHGILRCNLTSGLQRFGAQDNQPLACPSSDGLGIPIAIAVTSSRVLNLTFYPILIATRPVPKVAIVRIILV